MTNFISKDKQNKWHIHSLICSALVVLLISCTVQNSEVTGLRCEYDSNPLGIDVPSPRFSWKLVADERGVYQNSFQIVVGESLDAVLEKKGDCWDSGKISSNETVNIAYEGSPLKSNQTYFWRVGTWTNKGKQLWSVPASFHTGLLHSSDWEAKWITADEQIVDTSPVLRKEFSLHKKVKEAYAFVTACGFYEFYLNGKKAGDHLLDPAITDYRKRVLYSTYDVTDLLQQGNNAAGAMLGNGAYNMHQTKDRYSWGQGGSGLGNPCFLMQLNIKYEDGSQENIISDESWKYAFGPITFNNIYGGEDYDARKEIDGWKSVRFSDDGWKEVALAPNPGGRLKSQLAPPIKVTATLKPVAANKPSDGVYLFDLGQNIAGWWRVEVKGQPGQTIRIRGAETLNDSLFPKILEDGDRLSEKFNYHSQVWTDYTLKGNNNESYEPHFFYTGFRYIEVATDDKKDLASIKVEGRMVRSSLEQTGSFSSSDSLINKIYRAGLWSQMANTVGYPTDCPHREKGGYNGDGQIIAETSMHDFQMATFYTKWLEDMQDAQEENGRIPNTSPTLVGGMGGGVAWGSAYILIPWWMNHYYKDTRILKDHYPSMKKYISYLHALARTDSNPKQPYIIDDFDSYWYSLGEWCAPGQSDGPNHSVVSTFYYYYDTKLLSKIAEILGYSDDAMRYRALSDTIRQEFNKQFFDPETFLYGTDSTYQTYQLLALQGEMVAPEYREAVLNTIVDDIKQRNGHLNTGIIGTKYLWPVLTRENQGNLGFDVVTQKTYPGYGYWIENNSTTLLEEWSGEHSHNHQMFGSVVEYFYKYLAGIQSPMEGKTMAGYQAIWVQPFVPDSLQAVNASLETVAGKVISNWKKENSSFLYEVNIPANTRATVVLPAFNDQSVKLMEGSITVWENGDYHANVDGITDIQRDGRNIMIKIESGAYNFRLIKQ